LQTFKGGITGIVSSAQGHAQDAAGYAQEAAGYVQDAAEHAQEAAGYKDEASDKVFEAQAASNTAGNYSVLSKSWAIGDTGTRSGEATDNAMYYSQLSLQSALSKAEFFCGMPLNPDPTDITVIHISTITPSTPQIAVGNGVYDNTGTHGIVSAIDNDDVTVITTQQPTGDIYYKADKIFSGSWDFLPLDTGSGVTIDAGVTLRFDSDPREFELDPNDKSIGGFNAVFDEDTELGFGWWFVPDGNGGGETVFGLATFDLLTNTTTLGASVTVTQVDGLWEVFVPDRVHDSSPNNTWQTSTNVSGTTLFDVSTIELKTFMPHYENLSDEQERAKAAEDDLSNRIYASVADIETLKTDLSSEATARASADDELAQDIADEAAARADANSVESNARLSADSNLQSQIDALQGQTRRYMIDFDVEFGTDTPSLADVEDWLETEGLPPAGVSTSFKNSNAGQATYNHLFVCYTDPNYPDDLILSDDGIDTVSTASATTFGVVRTAKDILIDSDGDLIIGADKVSDSYIGTRVLSDHAAADKLPESGTMKNLFQATRNMLKWLRACFDASGSANTAVKLKDARTIALTGAVTGSATFDGSANASVATTLSGGVAMSAADKAKLDGVAAGANNYTLPAATASALGGVKVASANGLSVSSGALALAAATTTVAGAMSAADKAKLDGVAAGATKYTLPAATASALGGVKVASANGLSVSSGALALAAATTAAAGAMSAADKAKLDGVAAGATAVALVNNLTSTSTTAALTAAQGKALQDGKLQRVGSMTMTESNKTTAAPLANINKSRFTITLGGNVSLTAAQFKAIVNYNCVYINLKSYTLTISDNIGSCGIGTLFFSGEAGGVLDLSACTTDCSFNNDFSLGSGFFGVLTTNITIKMSAFRIILNNLYSYCSGTFETAGGSYNIALRHGIFFDYGSVYNGAANGWVQIDRVASYVRSNAATGTSVSGKTQPQAAYCLGYYRNDVVTLTGNQTINGTKTFAVSPVVPNKTAAATNSGTALATEAQVYAAKTSGFTRGNGWRRAPDGFTVQWGGFIMDSNTQWVNFPLAFTSAAVTVTGQASMHDTYTQDGTLTGFNAGGWAGHYFRYIATGYIS
jgi:hypothetical protein